MLSVEGGGGKEAEDWEPGDTGSRLCFRIEEKTVNGERDNKNEKKEEKNQTNANEIKTRKGIN